MGCTPDCERRSRSNANGAGDVVAIEYTDSLNNHLQVFATDGEFQGSPHISVEDVAMAAEARQHKNSQESLLLENLAALSLSRKNMHWDPGEED